MPAGREVYEDVLRNSEYPVIAMQVLAAGAIPPREALEYVSRLQGVTSILFGASTLSHIRETKELIELNDRER
jgi:aryl-alcohol dehydrogenase-like predicted oxidoreductase